MKKYILICLLFPFVTNAQVIFTEIVYNPDGTDSGREWIEVYNSGNTDVDLSAYTLIESGSNHTIRSWNDGSTIISPGEYGILADNPEKFLIDYQSYSKVLLDSAFSLVNSGEEIIISNASDITDDSVIYSPDWGGDGTENSLQRNGDIWIPAIPTPGEENAEISVDEGDIDDTDDSGGDDSTSTHDNQDDISDYEFKNTYEVDVGRERYVLVNKSVEFRVDESGEDEGSNKVYWSFGDGGYSKSDEPKHIYYWPGIYNVVATSKRGDMQAVSRTKVYVSSLQIEVEPIFWGKGVDILLKNNSKDEVNIGGFVVKTDIDSFKIPQNTILDGGQVIIFSHKVTRLEYEKERKIHFFYPSGDRVEL